MRGKKKKIKLEKNSFVKNFRIYFCSKIQAWKISKIITVKTHLEGTLIFNVHINVQCKHISSVRLT